VHKIIAYRRVSVCLIIKVTKVSNNTKKGCSNTQLPCCFIPVNCNQLSLIRVLIFDKKHKSTVNVKEQNTKGVKVHYKAKASVVWHCVILNNLFYPHSRQWFKKNHEECNGFLIIKSWVPSTKPLKKVHFSSCPQAKVSHLWHLGTSKAQLWHMQSTCAWIRLQISNSCIHVQYKYLCMCIYTNKMQLLCTASFSYTVTWHSV